MHVLIGGEGATVPVVWNSGRKNGDLKDGVCIGKEIGDWQEPSDRLHRAHKLLYRV